MMYHKVYRIRKRGTMRFSSGRLQSRTELPIFVREESAKSWHNAAHVKEHIRNAQARNEQAYDGCVLIEYKLIEKQVREERLEQYSKKLQMVKGL